MNRSLEERLRHIEHALDRLVLEVWRERAELAQLIEQVERLLQHYPQTVGIEVV